MSPQRRPGIDALKDWERLKQLERLVYGMTDSARPKAESRRIAKVIAEDTLSTLRQQVEYMEQQIARVKR